MTAEDSEKRKAANGINRDILGSGGVGLARVYKVAGSPFRIIEPSLTGLRELGLLHRRGQEQMERSACTFVQKPPRGTGAALRNSATI